MSETKPVWKVDKEAELQEMLASVTNMAFAIGKLYQALLHTGMTEDQAMTITIEWMYMTLWKRDA
jgi:hypothetical protein